MPILHEPHPALPSITSPNGGAPILAIDDLSFFYPDGRQALHTVSFTIHAGEKVALVGPNGAGKSTLLLHLNGLLQGNGRIQVGQLSLEKTTLPAIRAKVGLVFQSPDDQLFSPTVREDVAFGPLHMGLKAEEIETAVSRALEQVGMADYADRISYHLSVGEKKRIAVATVLAMQPDLLVLDEPSAGLDPRARRSLINLLRDLPQTMIVATHDLLLVRDLLPRMLVMDEGRIVADGRTEALLADAALLEKHGLELPCPLVA
ncbi:MAG: ABC transporter ATP-binding protein [Ardenticatenaceae bacterium]|nr:ABC transporter ATP-binding protein [Ardenticatenaceae bacterium]